jgi:hypothetical protein
MVCLGRCASGGVMRYAPHLTDVVGGHVCKLKQTQHRRQGPGGNWKGSFVPLYAANLSGIIINTTRWNYHAAFLNRLVESGSSSTNGWRMSKGILCPGRKVANATNGVIS